MRSFGGFNSFRFIQFRGLEVSVDIQAHLQHTMNSLSEERRVVEGEAGVQRSGVVQNGSEVEDGLLVGLGVINTS